MSDKTFIDTIKLENKWKPSRDFLEKSTELMFRNIVEYNADDEKEFGPKELLSEETFAYFWNKFPDYRVQLISLLESSMEESSWYRKPHFKKDFASKILSYFFQIIPDDDSIENIKLRHLVAVAIDEKLDYLSKIHKYQLIDNDDLFSLWNQWGLAFSKDPEFFDYAYSQVKRARGATEARIYIISCAADNNAIGDGLISVLAKRGTKKLKREIVGHLSNNMHSFRRQKEKVGRHSPNDTEAVENAQKDIDHLEVRLMMFVDCDDANVVENLMSALTKDNLPWLMPAASKNSYLSNRLQRMIDGGNDYY